MKRKSPVLAALLSLVLGPIGYLYIGWRYAVLALSVFLLFTFVLTVTDFPIPSWMKYITLAVLAWKGYTIVSVRNALIEAGDEQASALDTFPIAGMAMSDLLVGIGMFYAGAIGLYVAAKLILEGSVFRGILVLFIGTPALVWIASIVFGFIAMGADLVFASHAENIFRRKHSR